MTKLSFARAWHEGFWGVLKAAAASGALKSTSPYPGGEKAKVSKPVPVPPPIPGGGTSGSPTYLGLSPGNPSPTTPLPPYQMPVMGSPVGAQTTQRAPEQKGAPGSQQGAY